MPSLQGGSLEILLTVPLNWRLACSTVGFRFKRLRDFLGFKVTLKYRFYRLKIDYNYYNFNLARRGLFLFSKVKGTVSVISSDSSSKDGNARLTTIPSKPLSDLLFLWVSPLITNSYLIRQNFQGYRCESDIAIFTWNYVYSPFKIWFCLMKSHRNINMLDD